MIFGTQKTFAIETEVRFFSAGRPLGPMRLWIKNNPIGAFEVQHLGVANGFLTDIVADTGSRVNPCFEGQTPADIIRTIKENLYCADDPMTAGQLASAEDNAERFNKFLLCPDLGEDFDDVFAVLLDHEDEALLIWSSFEHVSRCDSIRLAMDEILGPMEQFNHWYECQTSVQ